MLQATTKENIEGLLKGKLINVEVFMDDTEDLAGAYCVALELHYLDDDGKPYSVVIKPDMDDLANQHLHIE